MGRTDMRGESAARLARNIACVKYTLFCFNIVAWVSNPTDTNCKKFQSRSIYDAHKIKIPCSNEQIPHGCMTQMLLRNMISLPTKAFTSSLTNLPFPRNAHRSKYVC